MEAYREKEIVALDSSHVSLMRRWAFDPFLFVDQALRVPKITTQQRDALIQVKKLVNAKIKLSKGEKLTDEEKLYSRKIGVSIMSGQGTGKDALASWLIIWFLCCFPYPKIPCTAPTAHQLRDVLWSEINKWLRQSAVKDWLTWQSDKVFFTEAGGKEWFATGRTANPKSTLEEQAETRLIQTIRGAGYALREE